VFLKHKLLVPRMNEPFPSRERPFVFLKHKVL